MADIMDQSGTFFEGGEYSSENNAGGIRVVAINRYTTTGRELAESGLAQFGADLSENVFAVYSRSTSVSYSDLHDHGIEHASGFVDFLTGAIGLRGTDEKDRFQLRGSDDVVDGRGGNDRIESGSGNDTITGGDGNDKVFAGKGDDVLLSTGGNDQLSGGKGLDSFLFSGSFGTATITDFSASDDRILIDTSVSGLTLDDILAATEVSGSDVIIRTGADQQIVIKNADLDSVKSALVIDSDGDFIPLVFSEKVPSEPDAIGTVIDAENGEARIPSNYETGEGVDISVINRWSVTQSDLLATGDVEGRGTVVLHVSAKDGGSSIVNYHDISDGVQQALQFGDLILDASSIVGTDFDDRFTGREGDDIVNLGGGDDRIRAGGGDDILDGGAGDDKIRSGTGDDTVIKSSGKDKIYLEGGNDTVIVGAGAEGVSTVMDFDVSADSIQINLPEVQSFEAVQSLISASVDGKGNPVTVIDFGDGNVVHLTGVSTDELTAANFVLPHAPVVEEEPATSDFEVAQEPTSEPEAAASEPEAAPEPASEPEAAPEPASEPEQTAGVEAVEEADPASEPEATPEQPAEAAAEPEEVADPIVGVQGSFNQGQGINLAAPNFFTNNQPFINVMKTASSWRSRDQDRKGVNQDSLEEMGLIDDHGWPTDIPADLFGGIDTTIFHRTLSEEYENLSGTYRLTYEGEGTVEVQGAVRGSVVVEDGVITFEYDAHSNNHLIVKIRDTDPNETGDYVRNIEVVNEKWADLYDAGEIFNPDFVDTVEDFSTLRFMDWGRTNNSEVATLADAPQVDNATYGGGVPIEVIVELANKTGADPWITIPHAADDDYVEHVATYVRDNLDPELKVYVEYSNEVWNSQFDQYHYARAQGEELFPDAARPHAEFHGYRATQIASIFEDTFGDKAEGSLHNVLAGRQSGTNYINDILATQVEIDGVLTTVGESGLFDSYAVTTYFAGDDLLGGAAEALGLVDPYDRTLSIEDFTQDQIDAAVAEIAARVSTYIDELEVGLQEHAQVAERFGLELTAYEGGSHVAAKSSKEKGLDWYVEILRAYNESELVVDAYADIQNAFDAAGGTLNTWFNDVGRGDEHGFWGHYRYLGDQNVRSDFLESLRSDNPVFTDGRVATDFDQGLTEVGTDESEVFLGTGEGDAFAGGAGDDVFNLVEGGDDNVHGGDGSDRVVLAGEQTDYTFTKDDNGVVRVIGPDGQEISLVDIEEIEFGGGNIISSGDLW